MVQYFLMKKLLNGSVFFNEKITEWFSIFFFPRAYMYHLVNHFSPHLSSLLVSPLQSDATSGGHAHDAAVALGSPRALQAFLAAQVTPFSFFVCLERTLCELVNESASPPFP